MSEKHSHFTVFLEYVCWGSRWLTGSWAAAGGALAKGQLGSNPSLATLPCGLRQVTSFWASVS